MLDLSTRAQLGEAGVLQCWRSAHAPTSWCCRPAAQLIPPSNELIHVPTILNSGLSWLGGHPELATW